MYLHLPTLKNLMKKLLVLGALALFGAMNAQTEKGSWVIGGSTTLGFNTASQTHKYEGESQDGPKTSTFAITPSVGYFVANKIAVGLDLGFASITQKFDGDKYTTSTFTVMPTGTYYFKSDSKVLPYLGVGVGFSSSKEDYGDGDDASISGLAYKGKGGIVFLLNQSVGIDLGLSYLGVNGKHSEDSKYKINTSTFGATVGVSVFLK